MEPTPPRSVGGLRWNSARPALEPEGPPGLAALLDAERSVLREYHERLSSLARASLAAEARRFALDDARRLQTDARRQTRGMRDRMRTRETDRRLLVADAKALASAAAYEAEAADLRVRAAQSRLDEVRGYVDLLAGSDRSAVEALRREATLPSGAELFPTIPAFISAQPGRAIGDPRLHDLIGEPLGDRWSLEEAIQPWVTTRWRAAWARSGEQPSGEIYAVEQAARPHAARRVWLLGAAPDDASARRQIESMLVAQPERNSLAALAAAVDAAR